MTAEVFVGLGANVGRVEATLREALERLREPIDIEVVSSLYRSEPLGVRDQPCFLNAALRGRTRLSPPELLAVLLATERDLGRVRRVPLGPRVLDLDLLLYEDRVLDEPGLSVPHPRMCDRRFVLDPLAEIAPEVVHPVSGLSVGELLAALTAEGWVERLSTDDWPPASV